jgi:hypothetical protein
MFRKKVKGKTLCKFCVFRILHFLPFDADSLREKEKINYNLHRLLTCRSELIRMGPYTVLSNVDAFNIIIIT